MIDFTDSLSDRHSLNRSLFFYPSVKVLDSVPYSGDCYSNYVIVEGLDIHLGYSLNSFSICFLVMNSNKLNLLDVPLDFPLFFI